MANVVYIVSFRWAELKSETLCQQKNAGLRCFSQKSLWEVITPETAADQGLRVTLYHRKRKNLAVVDSCRSCLKMFSCLHGLQVGVGRKLRTISSRLPLKSGLNFRTGWILSYSWANWLVKQINLSMSHGDKFGAVPPQPRVVKDTFGGLWSSGTSTDVFGALLSFSISRLYFS